MPTVRESGNAKKRPAACPQTASLAAVKHGRYAVRPLRQKRVNKSGHAGQMFGTLTARVAA